MTCYSRYAWGRLYTSKLPMTAVHVMNNDVLPTFEAHDARITTVLSDNGREFCGRPDRHPYELFITCAAVIGVRGVWSRHKLLTKHERLLRLEKHVGGCKIELSDEQIRLLERFSPEFRERHIETRHSGDLVAVDTFFVGHLKGVGKVYLQTVVDCYSRYAWGRLYTSKLPMTAVHVMNNDVLPTFEAHDARITTVLSDNGREFCGRPDRHPYELFLQLEEIEHRTTKVRRPQSNGYVERLHRTLLDEHFRVMGRKKFYESVDEMQTDLDAYLIAYNTKRPHQGRNMNGRTPEKVFLGGLPSHKNRKEEKSKKAA